MAKQIAKNTTYKYSFTSAGSVTCTVTGGSAKIWISGNETGANTYTATGQGGTNKFPVTSLDAASQGNSWILHLKGLNDSNTVDVTVPSPGTWNPTPTNT